MKKIYIIHGYFASPTDHWFPWFVEKVHADYGIEVEVLRMPTPDTPDMDEWLEKLHDKIGMPSNETFIIAHSLGCITLLHYLDTLQENFALGGMILVSPFDKPLEVFPNLNSFVDITLDFSKLSRSVAQKYVIFSDNDMYVPPFISKTIGVKLDSALLEIPRGGHFLGIEGFETFPELYEIFKTMLAKR
ncbi:serine hydrolase family protein [Sulfurospirillum diekertiae]|uniref:Serine hydrolase family protein n=1 Tax=Sulfurospirillum diekertiae TaxID=1854492 RepID=A0A6G9VUT7_9BACT|nr:alpha/beta hydrolase [Sulfurospirillum diekertiae]QIR76751.1 serine hydrolase family protein [Sulfurospirillum diekertiae]QIR79383.1 serine hydrolase family protein [Sulfurospirillum diekertiae]